MKRPSSSKKSRTSYRRLRAMKDADIQLTPEHPEANVKHIVRGIVRNGLRAPARKASISLRIDADVLEWFRHRDPVTKLASTLYFERTVRLPDNKQLQRTVKRHRGRAASAPFDFSRASRFKRQSAAAGQRR